MAISIDYSDPTPQYVIEVPRADMALVQSVPFEVRELDLDTFRKELGQLQANVEGIAFPTNHNHTPPFVSGGVTLARVVAVLEPYVVRFEDGLYNVNVIGGNSNLSDRVLKNSVGVNTANSAGLVVVQGAAISEAAHVSLISDGGTGLHAIAWLERNGHPVITGMVSGTVELLDPAGATVIPAAAMTLDPATGVFTASLSATLTASTNYWARVVIVDADGTTTGYRATPTFA